MSKTKTTNTPTIKQHPTFLPTKQSKQDGAKPVAQSGIPGITAKTMETLNEEIKDHMEEWDDVAEDYGKYGCPFWKYLGPPPRNDTCPMCHYDTSLCECSMDPTDLNNYMSRSFQAGLTEWRIKNYDPFDEFR